MRFTIILQVHVSSICRPAAVVQLHANIPCPSRARTEPPRDPPMRRPGRPAPTSRDSGGSIPEEVDLWNGRFYGRKPMEII